MKEFLTAVLLCGAALGADGGVRPQDGGLWPDDKGVHVNAHGGGVLFAEGRYWWYGEHKVAGRAGNKAMVGVHAYSSANLTDWKDEGIVLPVSDDPTSDIVKGCVIERPKVLRSRKTGRYAMYFHLELKGQRYDAARTGLAVADRPDGPFTFLRSFRPTAGAWPLNAKPEDRTPETRRAACELGAESTLGPGAGGPLDKVRSRVPYVAHVEGGQMSRDMTLFMDDDGTAYHVFASEYNSTLHVAELTDDLLGYTGRWSRITEMEWTEAPALFKRGGWYYLVGSGCTGWKPNTARSYRARNVFGPWERLDNPCVGTNPSNGLGPELTWGGQSTCVFKIEGTDDFVAMFDIWRPEDAIDGRYVWKRISFTDDGRVRIPFGGASVRVPTGEVRPAAVFSDHAVLRRAADTPVFGRATPGSAVRVAIAGVAADTVAGADGTWLVRLDLRNVGEGPFTLAINDRLVRDVLVGEVWLASGQSNMQSPEGRASDAKEMCALTNSRVRCYVVPARVSPEPSEGVPGLWRLVSPEVTPSLSGVGFQFSLALQAALDRPVGFVFAAVGASKIEAWCDAESLRRHPADKAEADALAAKFAGYRKYAEACEKARHDWERACDRADVAPHGGIPTDGWKALSKAEAERFGRPAGEVWVRRTVTAAKGEALVVSRNRFISPQWRFDMSEMEFYWNGKRLTRRFSDNPINQNMEYYDVAGADVAAANALAVRVFDSEGIPNVLHVLYVNGRHVPYAGWSVAEGRTLPPLTAAEAKSRPARQTFCLPQHYPSGLYNGMVDALVPMGLSGVIWYQGESNTDRPEAYESLFRTLITSWREKFGRDDLPFAWCQLAAYGKKSARPDGENDAWPRLRAAQNRVRDLPRTGQAVLIDAGESEDIHPSDKRTPGRRLADWALREVYGQEGRPSRSPRFVGVMREGDALVVRFRDVGKGLCVRDLGTNYVVLSRQGKTAPVKRNSPKAEVEGFAVAGANGVWHWADEATIEGGDAVRVRAEAVREPQAVRYGWSANPYVNLYGSDGLPATPFGARFAAPAASPDAASRVLRPY